jgi:ribosome modulation factor
MTTAPALAFISYAPEDSPDEAHTKGVAWGKAGGPPVPPRSYNAAKRRAWLRGWREAKKGRGA